MRAPGHDTAGSDQAFDIAGKANLIAVVWRGPEKLHYLNATPLHEICERWIGKYERHRLQVLSNLRKGLESATGRIRRGGQTKKTKSR
jgi:hypothetical protein